MPNPVPPQRAAGEYYLSGANTEQKGKIRIHAKYSDIKRNNRHFNLHIIETLMQIFAFK
jgi:hypothetical protein